MKRLPSCKRVGLVALMLALLLAVSACAGGGSPAAMPAEERATQADQAHDERAHDATDHAIDNHLPVLEPLDLSAGELVNVVATTNIVADIVAQVGGDRIELIALMPPGADPHGYTVTPQDLRRLNDANVIFVNGLALEEALLPLLTNLDRAAPLVSVNVGVDTVEFDGDPVHHDDDDHDPDHDPVHHGDDEHDPEHDPEHHYHDGNNPHTWQSVRNVMVWVANVETVLSALDPENAAVYAANAEAYVAELDALDAEIRRRVDDISPANRLLVTDHDTFSYFALDYGFEVIGAVIPGFSTLAAASAQELAALQDQIQAENVQAIFVGTTVNPGLAERMAEDLGIRVVPLYSDSLSEVGGPAATYVDFMRYNVEAIVDALR